MTPCVCPARCRPITLKQLAQELVRTLAGEMKLVNQIDVSAQPVRER